MTTKARVGTRSGVPVVSLTNPRTAQIFFENLGHTSKERRELRGDIFKQISRNTKLQDELLSVVAKHPAVQRRILLELARDLQFRKRVLESSSVQEHPILQCEGYRRMQMPERLLFAFLGGRTFVPRTCLGCPGMASKMRMILEGKQPIF